MVDLSAEGRRVAALIFGLTEDERNRGLLLGDVVTVFDAGPPERRVAVRMGSRPFETPPTSGARARAFDPDASRPGTEANVQISFSGPGARDFQGEYSHHLWDIAVLANRWDQMADVASFVLTQAQIESIPVTSAQEVFDNKQYSVILTLG